MDSNLRFFIDTQLPPSLIKVFEHYKHDAIHTTIFPQGHLLDDFDIRKIAIKENRIIVSKDNDFYDTFFLKGFPPSILFINTGNIINRVLFKLISAHIEEITRLFSRQDAHLIILSGNGIISY